MNELHQSIEQVTQELVNICCAALKESGVHISVGSRTYEALFDVMSNLAQPGDKR